MQQYRVEVNKLPGSLELFGRLLPPLGRHCRAELPSRYSISHAHLRHVVLISALQVETRSRYMAERAQGERYVVVGGGVAGVSCAAEVKLSYIFLCV